MFVQAYRSNLIHIHDGVINTSDGGRYHKTRCNRRLKVAFISNEPTRTIGAQCDRCGDDSDYEQVNTFLRAQMLARKEQEAHTRQRELAFFNKEQAQRQQAVPEIQAALEALGWTVEVERHAGGVTLTGKRGVLNFEMGV